MLRSLLIFIFICTFTIVKAQFESQFSQNMFNLLSVNPGYAGTSGGVEATGFWRTQWGGVEGAPKTAVFSADSRLKFLGYEHGIGVNFLKDDIGSFSAKKFTFDYAFKVDLLDGQLSSGLSVGVINQTLDGSALSTMPKSIGSTSSLPEDDDHKPEQFTKEASTKIDFGLGVFFKEKNLYGGISVLHLQKPKLDLGVNIAQVVRRTLFLTGGYIFNFEDKDLDFEPSIFYKSDGSISQIDVAGLVKYKKRFWGGFSYRLQDAINGMLGLEMKNGLKVGCSYAFTTSKLSGSQSLEVMVSYNFTVGVSKKSKQYRSVRYL